MYVVSLALALSVYRSSHISISPSSAYLSYLWTSFVPHPRLLISRPSLRHPVSDILSFCLYVTTPPLLYVCTRTLTMFVFCHHLSIDKYVYIYTYISLSAFVSLLSLSLSLSLISLSLSTPLPLSFCHLFLVLALSLSLSFSLFPSIGQPKLGNDIRSMRRRWPRRVHARAASVKPLNATKLCGGRAISR